MRKSRKIGTKLCKLEHYITDRICTYYFILIYKNYFNYIVIEKGRRTSDSNGCASDSEPTGFVKISITHSIPWKHAFHGGINAWNVNVCAFRRERGIENNVIA